VYVYALCTRGDFAPRLGPRHIIQLHSFVPFFFSCLNVIHDFIFSTTGKSVFCYVVHKIPNSIVCSLLSFLAVFCEFYAVTVHGTHRKIHFGHDVRHRYDFHIRHHLTL
jgi:hypothetical protein